MAVGAHVEYFKRDRISCKGTIEAGESAGIACAVAEIARERRRLVRTRDNNSVGIGVRCLQIKPVCSTNRRLPRLDTQSYQ